jgi:hypothetical protein
MVPPKPVWFWPGTASKSVAVYVVQFGLFWVICVVVNYSMKLVINPEPGWNFVPAIENLMVLFGKYPAPLWNIFLGQNLLRVVRQANHVAFWAVVGLVKRSRAGKAEVDRESEHEQMSGHTVRADCDKRANGKTVV